jgi:hypothetical protein
MTVKASGRSALILATGLFVCVAGPSQASADADTTTANSTSENAAGAPMALNKNLKYSSRHRKSYAHRKFGKVARVAEKPTDDKKASTTDVAADDIDNLAAIPPSVANANAQLPSADAPAGNAKAMSARANDMLQAAPDNPANAKADNETLIVTADQLNDVDRALHEGKRPTAMASANAPAAPIMASSNESSTWDQTSLIGRIFIGFGALLTMASAARMFMT